MLVRRSAAALLCTALAAQCTSASAPDVSDDAADPPDGPRVVSVNIVSTPDTLRFLGATVSLVALAVDSSGAPVGGVTITWLSLAPTVVSVGNDGIAKAVSSGEALVVATGGALSDTVSLVVHQRTTSVEVTPALDTLTFRGDTVTLGAVPRDSGGTRVSHVSPTWVSADTSVARVASSGQVTARGFGEVLLTASADGAQGAARIVVVQRPVGIQVTEGPLTLPVGIEADLLATVVDGAGEEVTAGTVTWVSRDPAVATVTASGRAKGMAPGATWAVATSGPLRDSVGLTVQQSLVGIAVSPASVQLDALEDVATFTAYGLDGGGNTLPGALAAGWRATNGSVVTSLGDGRFRASHDGTTSVVATVGGMEAQALLTVKQRATRVTLSSDDDTLRALTATTAVHGVAEDRRGHPIPSGAITYTSSNAGVAAVNATTGVVTGMAPGSSWIVGSMDAARDSVTILVRQDPTRVRVSGGNQSLSVGQSVKLAAQVLDAKDQTISGLVVNWTSSAPSVVSVDSEGTASALAMGSAWVVAHSEALRDSVQITVASVHQGNLVIRDAADLAAAAAAGYTGVVGALTIQGTSLTSVDGLQTITEVTGAVTVASNGALRDLAGLSGLSAAGSLRVEGNGVLETLALPSLETVSGDVYLGTGTGTIAVSLPSLRRTRRFEIFGDTEPDLSFPELEQTNGMVNLQVTNARSVAFGGLVCTHGLFLVRGAELESISASALAEVGYCAGAPGLQDGTDLKLSDNPKLTDVSLAALRVVNNNIVIERTALGSLALPSLETAASVSIRHSPITTLSISSLRNVGTVVIDDIAAEEFDLPATSTYAYVTRNPALRHVGVGLTGGHLEVTDNPALESLDLTGWVSGEIRVQGNQSLLSLTIPSRANNGLVIVRDNAALRSLSGPALESVSGIGISGSPALDDVSFPVLGTMGGGLTVSGTALTDLSGFAALRSGLGGLTLSGNSALNDVTGLAGLGDALSADPIITGNVSITDNPTLGSAAIQTWLDQLEAKYPGTAIAGSVTLSGNG